MSTKPEKRKHNFLSKQIQWKKKKLALEGYIIGGRK